MPTEREPPALPRTHDELVARLKAQAWPAGALPPTTTRPAARGAGPAWDETAVDLEPDGIALLPRTTDEWFTRTKRFGQVTYPHDRMPPPTPAPPGTPTPPDEEFTVPTAPPALAGLTDGRLLFERVEAATLAAGAEMTLADMTGPGVISTVWMAVRGGAGALDGRLRIFYDGATSPAFDVDLGTLLVTHFSPVGSYGVEHLGVEIGANRDTGFLLRFPAPFGARVRVTLLNSSSAAITEGVFSQIAYRLATAEEAGPFRLRSTGVRFTGRATLTASQTLTLASLTNRAGWLAYLAVVGGYQATNRSWMERNVEIVTDGADPVVSTGLEDFFDGAWYFHDRAAYSINGTAMVGAHMPAGNETVCGMATDLMTKWGGVGFDSSLTVRLLTEPRCTTGHAMCWCALVYA